MTHDKGSEPSIWGTVYISNVNGARKVKSSNHEQELKPRAEIFSKNVASEDFRTSGIDELS